MNSKYQSRVQEEGHKEDRVANKGPFNSSYIRKDYNETSIKEIK